MTQKQKPELTGFITADIHVVFTAQGGVEGALSLTGREGGLKLGDTDYDSAVANTRCLPELLRVVSLSRSGGDNKTNYSIMGIIPLFQPETGALDRREPAG